MMTKKIKWWALIVGFVLGLVVVIFGAVVLTLPLALVFGENPTGPIASLSMWLLGVAGAVLTGYITGRLGKPYPFLHALTLAGILLVINLLSTLNADAGNLWRYIQVFVSAGAIAIGGGLVRSR